MCQTCGDNVIDILKSDLHQRIIDEKEDILCTPEILNLYGEAYDDFAIGFRKFQHSCFLGDYSDENAKERMDSWKNQFETMKENIKQQIEQEKPKNEEEANLF